MSRDRAPTAIRKPRVTRHREHESLRVVMLDRLTVARAIAVSVPTFNRMLMDGRFPKPQQITAGRVAWRSDVVEEFIENISTKYAPKQMPPPPFKGKGSRKAAMAAKQAAASKKAA